jgi:hypothetical protein
MELYIIHELTAIPTSLFKNSKMRKPAKARLAQTAKRCYPKSTHCCKYPFLDGGTLLNKVKWLKKSFYR